MATKYEKITLTDFNNLMSRVNEARTKHNHSTVGISNVSNVKASDMNQILDWLKEAYNGITGSKPSLSFNYVSTNQIITESTFNDIYNIATQIYNTASAQPGDVIESFTVTYPTGFSGFKPEHAFMVCNKYLYMTSNYYGDMSGYVKVDVNSKTAIQGVQDSSGNGYCDWSASEHSSTDAIVLGDRYNGYIKRWLNGNLHWTINAPGWANVVNDGSDYIAVHYSPLFESNPTYYFQIYNRDGGMTFQLPTNTPWSRKAGVDANGRIVFANEYRLCLAGKGGGYSEVEASAYRYGVERYRAASYYTPLDNNVDVFIGESGDWESSIGYCVRGDYPNRNYFKGYSKGKFKIHRKIGNDIIVSNCYWDQITLYRFTVNNKNNSTSGVTFTTVYEKSFSGHAIGVGNEYAYVVNRGTGNAIITKVLI